MSIRLKAIAIAALLLSGALLMSAIASQPTARPAPSDHTPTRHPAVAPILTLSDAARIMEAAKSKAADLNASGAIAVTDAGGHLLMLERLDGTFPAGSAVSAGKARTAATFRKPTKAFEDSINGGRIAMAAMSDFTPLQGGIPLIIDGVVVGGIGVSGAHSAAEDEQIALAGAEALVTHTARAGD
jgi:glc operon protein GlcG